MEVEIIRNSGATERVTAYPTACPALVVHESLQEELYGWIITHAKSGVALGTYPHRTRVAAEQIASRLALADLDWDFDTDTRPRGEAAEPYRLAFQAALDGQATIANRLPNSKGKRHE